MGPDSFKLGRHEFFKWHWWYSAHTSAQSTVHPSCICGCVHEDRVKGVWCLPGFLAWHILLWCKFIAHIRDWMIYLAGIRLFIPHIRQLCCCLNDGSAAKKEKKTVWNTIFLSIDSFNYSVLSLQNNFSIQGHNISQTFAFQWIRVMCQLILGICNG